MNNNATLEKMTAMKLFGMANSYSNLINTEMLKNYSTSELLAHLIDTEWDTRYNRKLTRLLTNAKFRYQASLSDIDYSKTRNLDKNIILGLSETGWLDKGINVIITGATGSGKSYLCCALGHQACINGQKVIYFNAIKLFSALKYAKVDGSYLKELSKIAGQDLLILDDFGLKILDNESRLFLLEILEDRYGKKSTIISSQLPCDKWHDIIGEITIADAICDRIIHNSYKINLQGDSMRKKNKVVLENNCHL